MFKSIWYRDKGSLRIDYKTYGSKIFIRPDKKSMNGGLFDYFRPARAGRWEVCGSAHPLKQWVSTTTQRDEGSTSIQTPTGPKELLGVKEGEWLRNWKDSITRAVRKGYQSPKPLNIGFTGSAVRVSDLDGWNDEIKIL